MRMAAIGLAALALAGCVDPYGRVDVPATVALGAVGAGTAVLGGAVVSDLNNRAAYAYAPRPAAALPPIAGGPAYYPGPAVGYPRRGYGSPFYDHGYGTPWGGPRFYNHGGTYQCSPWAWSSC